MRYLNWLVRGAGRCGGRAGWSRLDRRAPSHQAPRKAFTGLSAALPPNGNVAPRVRTCCSWRARTGCRRWEGSCGCG